MKAFTQHEGLMVALDRANVDTDLIIPKQFLKSIRRTGFGPNLFDDIRYLDPYDALEPEKARRPDPVFPLNQDRFKGASVLLARDNFGCGSSREHAVWALDQFGIRSVIAPSFADIFKNNSFKSGLLPIEMPASVIDAWFETIASGTNVTVTIDLEEERLIDSEGGEFGFAIDPFRRHCLLNGLDDIGITLQSKDRIREFEAQHQAKFPWLFREASL